MDYPSYGDFLKEAFGWRTKVPGLGRMPINQLALAAFAVLGIANPGFWFLGAAAEIGYLVLKSTSPRFQALVRAQQLMADKESYSERVHRAVGRLSDESQARYRRLLVECRQIQGIADVQDEAALSGVRDLRGSGLNQLLWIFLRLLNSRQILDENILRVDREAIAHEIGKLETRVGAAAGNPALERSLKGTLEIRRKRLENLDNAARSRNVIEAELERIEQQVFLIREEAAVTGKAELLSQRLDSVTRTLTETNSWMEQNAEIFGEMGADPLGSAPADLPEVTPPIPPKMETEG
jgi:hypothetical protein